MVDLNEDEEKKRKIEDAKVDQIVDYVRSLGLEKLARDISDEKFMRRILDARISYDYHVLQSEIWKDRSERALEFAVSAQAALFDKAATYNNIVIMLGYAGFFAIWNITANQLDQIENAFIGVCLAISLMTFVAWTVLNGFVLTLNIKRYAVIANTEFDTFAAELDAHRTSEDKIKRSVLKLQRFWPIVFFITVFFGLVPGVFLLTELLQVIGGIEIKLIQSAWELIK